MNTSTQHAGRRRSIIAVTASVVLALLGVIAVFMQYRHRVHHHSTGQFNVD